MVKYLQMDGVDDVLTVPAFSFTDVELDIAIEKKTTWGKYFSTNYTWFQQNSNTVNDQWDTGSISTVLKDGISQTNLTPFAPLNERHIYTIKFLAIRTHTSYVFANMSSTVAQTGGKIYGTKYFNGTTLVAHYDMSTGTVLDQSGNGNHATLTGGTWLDDGTGGGTEPIGEDGSALFTLSQKIYSDESILTSINQKIYSDEILSNLTSQTIYQDNSIPYISNQIIYQDDATYFNSKQVLYEDSSTFFATLQEIFNDGQIGSVAYSLLLQLYVDDLSRLSTKQLHYEDILTQHITYQQLYENNQTLNSTRQIIYSDSISNYPTHQKIYSDTQSEYTTKQSIYENQSVNLSTLQQLFEHSSMGLQTKQSIYQLDTIELLTLQSIYEDNSMSIDTLQQFLSDYVEYRQVFKYLLGINRQSNFELSIVGSQKFGVDISDRVIRYDLNVSDQIKKYDLNI